MYGRNSSSHYIYALFTVPDSHTLKLMLQREAELQASKLCQQAYGQPYCDRRAINTQLQLRTVREFGLPDTTIEILQNSQLYYSNTDSVTKSLQLSRCRRFHSSPVRGKLPSPLPSRRSNKLGSPSKPAVCVSPTRAPPVRSKEVRCHRNVSTLGCTLAS